MMHERKFAISIHQLDLLKGIADELKLPLAQIMNAASLLQTAKLSASERRSHYEAVESVSRRMIQLVDAVLYAGLVEQDQTRLQLEPTNLGAVTVAVSRDIKHLAAMYDTSLSLYISQALLPAAVDPQALRHVLNGLVDMYVRSPEVSEVELFVRQRGDQVIITLRSNARPFTDRTLSDAIQLVSKRDQPLKNHPTASGVALMVAKSLIDAMNGSLNFVTLRGGKSGVVMHIPISQQLQLMDLQP